jgi:hypothetical protein
MQKLMNASVELPGAERDNPALWIVGRDANRDAVARHNLDAEPAHPAAQLRQHLVAGVYLHAVQPTAVHGDDRALHVDKIVLTHLVKQPLCHMS